MKKLKTYLVLLLLLSPSLILIFLDKSIWGGDNACYGAYSLELFYALVQEPFQWLGLLLRISVEKAPMISWIGQFFVPLGYIIGSIDTGLLLSVFIAKFIAIILLFHIFQELFKKSLISFAGCLIVAACPQLFNLSVNYWVGPFQLLSVIWFVYIMVFAPKWDRLYIILQLLASTSFAMLVKITSPLFCLGPGIVILAYAFRSGLPPIRFTRRHLIISFFAGTLALGCVAWYRTNLITAVRFARQAAFVDADARDTFWNKFLFWLDTMKETFFLPGIAFAIIPLFIVAVYLFFKGKNKKQVRNAVALVAIFQFTFALSAYSVTTQNCPRFLLPFLPYLAILICWSLDKVNKPMVTVLISAIFCFQLLMVNAYAFRIIEAGKYCLRVEKLNAEWKDGSKVGVINEILRITRVDKPKGRPNIIGIRSNWLNHSTLRYYASKRLSPRYIDINFRYDRYERIVNPLDCFQEHFTAEKAWKRLLLKEPAYFLSVNPNIIRKNEPSRKKHLHNFFNEMGAGVLEKVKTSGMFEQVPLPKYPEVLIFKYVGQNKNR